MPQYFDEAHAQALLAQGLIDECIVYSIPCVEAQMGLPQSTTKDYEDLHSEYLLYLTMAIQRYDPTKGSKLFTWIQNYLRYARLNWLKKEMPYTACMVQTIQGLIPLGKVEDLAITPKRRRGRPWRIMA